MGESLFLNSSVAFIPEGIGFMSGFFHEKNKILEHAGLSGTKVYIFTYAALRRAKKSGRKIYVDPETRVRFYINFDNYTDREIEELIPLKRLDYARRQAYYSEFIFKLVLVLTVVGAAAFLSLDITSLSNVLANKGYLESMAEEDGDVWAGEHLGSALLGFHGIEYIIYSDGQTKKAADITDDELIYSVAVAGDLRNRCVQLEVSWAGDKASQAKQDLMEELEFPITASNSQFSYGENMLNAGLPGSTYRTVRAAAAQILDGAFTIADEVGNIKIGNAASGDDVNYIESPFSHNSLTDFIDNVKSIENAFYGGAYGDRNNSKSLSAYLMKVNPGVEKAVADAITASYAAINAIPAPFVNNYADPKADEAVIVVGETLARALTAAQTVISEE